MSGWKLTDPSYNENGVLFCLFEFIINGVFIKMKSWNIWTYLFVFEIETCWPGVYLGGIMLYLHADGITKGHNPTSTTPKPQKEKNTQKNKPPEDA